MSNIRGALESRRREFEPPPGGLSRLHSLRRRRRRNRRMATAAVALALSGGMLFGLTRAFQLGQARPHVPGSQPITPRTVGRLELAWSARVEPDFVSSVVAAGGRLYVHSPHSGLSAFAASCPAPSCSSIWTAQMAGPKLPAGTPPAVWGSRVFLTTDRLLTIDAACGTGGARCGPLVIEDPPVAQSQLSGPAVSDGVVYVGTAAGRLLAYRADCVSTTGCRPIWSARTGGSIANSTPAVDSGLIYVLSDRLYAFPATCKSGTDCRPRWTAAVGDTLTGPVAAGGMVYVSHDDRLYAFTATCGSNGATCTPAWTFRDPAGLFLTTPATEGGMVFVAGSKLFALDPRCGTGGAECGAAWAGDLGSKMATAPPTLGSGLVFVSSDRLLAFAQTCAARTCQPLWRGPASTAPLSQPALSDQIVAVANTDGRLMVFDVKPRA